MLVWALFSYKTVVSILLVAVLLYYGHLTPAHAAWTQPQGTWFTANGLSHYSTRNFIDDSGRSIPQPEFSKLEWNSYLEYGLYEGLTIGANMFLHEVTADYHRYTPNSSTITSGTDENYGLADSEFFIRQRLWSGMFLGKDMVISVQPLIKLPSLYKDGGNPRSGTDNADAELRLRLGYNFTSFRRQHFFTQDIAYRIRFGKWRDQFRGDSTLGFALNDSFTLLLQNFVTWRTEGTARSTQSSAEVNDYDLIKAQVSVVYRMDEKTRIQLGGFRHTYARNTGDGDGWLLSVWREF